MELFRNLESQRIYKQLLELRLCHFDNGSLKFETDLLNMLELKLHSSRIIPFDDCLKKCAPTYLRMHQLSQELGVKFLPLRKTEEQRRFDFNPFLDCVYFPSVQQDLAKLGLNNSQRQQTISDFLKFNFSFFHELSHFVICRLMPPSTDLKKLTDYFIFSEAIVGILEWQTHQEMGHELYELFAQYNITWPLMKKDNKLILSPDNLIQLIESGINRQKTAPSLYSQKWLPEFIKNHSSEILSLYEVNSTRKIQLEEFDISKFKSDNSLKLEFWSWYKENFVFLNPQEL